MHHFNIMEIIEEQPNQQSNALASMQIHRHATYLWTSHTHRLDYLKKKNH